MARAFRTWPLLLSVWELGGRRLVAEANRIAFTEAAWEKELDSWVDLEGKELSVTMGSGAKWSISGEAASACGIEFRHITYGDLREEHKTEHLSKTSEWYVVGADGGNAKGCKFSAHLKRVLQSEKVTVGMHLDGEPGQGEFSLSYIPAVFHMDETAGPSRSLELGYDFPSDDRLRCEADKVGVYCFGALTTYHCTTWVTWKKHGDSCDFKTMVDLTSLSASMKDAGHGGTKLEGYDQLEDKIKLEYAAYDKASLKLTGFRVKTYKTDKSEAKTGGSWNQPMTAAAPGITLKRVLYHVYSFAKYRGWYTQMGNNCQMFAAWMASNIKGETVKPAYWLVFSPVNGVPLSMPNPESTGDKAVQEEKEKESS